MQQKAAAIIANGTITDKEETASHIRTFSYLIAADGGLSYLDKIKLTPDLIIGDFDSANEDLLKQYSSVPSRQFPRDKDESDLELAIDAAISMGYQKIVIFGALERRIDHTLYNLHLLTRFPEIVSMESDYEVLFVIEKNKTVKCRPGQTVSLLPLCEQVVGVTTQGLKWELTDAIFDRHGMSLSNVCVGDSFSVSMNSGFLLCSLCK